MTHVSLKSYQPHHAHADSREGLQHYMHQALYEEGSPWKADLLADSTVLDSHIAEALKNAEGALGKSPARDLTLPRAQLVDMLANVVDEIGLMPAIAPYRVRAETIAHVHDSESGNNAIGILNRWESDRLMGTTANVTQRVMHSLRKNIGWVPLSDICGERNPFTHAVVDMLRERFIANAMHIHHVSHENAATMCDTNYIAKTVKTRAPAYESDPPIVLRTEVDFSPQAAKDFTQEFALLKARGKIMRYAPAGEPKNLSDLLERWGFSRSHYHASVFADLLPNILDSIRTAEIGRLQVTEKIPQEDARQWVDESYLKISTSQDGKRRYAIYPRALADVDKAIQGLFPQRTPRAEGSTGGAAKPSYYLLADVLKEHNIILSDEKDVSHVRKIVTDLRDKEMTRMREQMGRTEAELHVNANYIAIFGTPGETFFCRIYPSALQDVSRAVNQAMPQGKSLRHFVQRWRLPKYTYVEKLPRMLASLQSEEIARLRESKTLTLAQAKEMVDSAYIHIGKREDGVREYIIYPNAEAAVERAISTMFPDKKPAKEGDHAKRLIKQAELAVTR